ncbi:MAG: VCBS repeat-containing protein, partial [Akkermansiaceae bacterium]|nr:VCBS repeat-containing protein [Akkermansiaceae bacterium]
NYEAPNHLYLNDGTGVFREAAREFGLDLHAAFLMAAFADYDRDGDLDVYLLGHRYFRAEGRPSKPPTLMKNGKLVVRPEFEKYYGLLPRANQLEINEVGAPDLLLRNDSGA